MKTKHIIIILVIILIIIFLIQKKEHAGSTTPTLSNEAIQNIAKIYADTIQVASFNNINITAWKGMITMWSGDEDKIPYGWKLCDGKNGTPDLRGRFILGSGQGSGLTNRSTGQTGGTETHTLTIDEMPTHSHFHWDTRKAGGSDGNTSAAAAWNDNQVYGGPTDTTGGNKPHNIMPPYYVLAYIIKT